MVRLVLNILLFIILAVFIALNAQNTTTVDLFGYEIESVSVAAVVTIAMAVGRLYSFALYLSNYLVKHRAQRAKAQKQKNKEKAGELKERAKEIEHTTKTPEAPPASDPVDQQSEPKSGWSLFGKKKKKNQSIENETEPAD